MECTLANRLKEKNDKLIEIVIEKIKREYQNDIDLIGVCGSFYTGDFHEKSDLDLLVVLNNDRGWGFSHCFILEGVGYDLYGSPWEKLEKMAVFDHTFVSHVIDVDIVYSSAPEHVERFMKLREKALGIINGPMTEELLKKSRVHLDSAVLALGNMMLEEESGAVRKLSGYMLNDIINTVCFLNHNYLKLGVKRHLEELLAMERVPKNFKENFMAVIYSEAMPDMKEAAVKLLKSVKELFNEIEEEIIDKPEPNKDNIRSTYEEVWSNWKNKIHHAAAHGDVFLAFSTGVSCQYFYDMMHREAGTACINLMKGFNPQDLKGFAYDFDDCMKLYKVEYEKLGMEPVEYASIEEFRQAYLGQ